MCHHGDETVPESWREEFDEEVHEADRPTDDEPSFANEESDVEVDLLETDDD